MHFLGGKIFMDIIIMDSCWYIYLNREQGQKIRNFPKLESWNHYLTVKLVVSKVLKMILN